MAEIKFQFDREFPLTVFLTDPESSLVPSGMSLVIPGVGAFPVTTEHLKELFSRVKGSESELTTDVAIAGLLQIMLRKEE